MINIEYDNPELEMLLLEGKSILYKEIQGKKGFVKSLQAFLFLLKVISNTKELSFYKQYGYMPSKEESYVLIKGSKISRKLMFVETDQGRCITITNLTN